jgi:hypothetical protein
MDKKLRCHEWRISTLPVPNVLPSSKNLVATMLMVHCKVICDGGVRESTRYGKAEVYKKGFEILEKLSLSEFRESFGCRCGANSSLKTRGCWEA